MITNLLTAGIGVLILAGMGAFCAWGWSDIWSRGTRTPMYTAIAAGVATTLLICGQCWADGTPIPWVVALVCAVVAMPIGYIADRRSKPLHVDKPNPRSLFG